MTTLLNDDALALDRRARVVTACIRAAYAWSVRDRELRAWDEIARMTGVVMLQLGPEAAPCTPMDLIRSLRRPLGELLPPPAAHLRDAGGIDDAVLLAGDDLTDTAATIGSDYVRSIMSGIDPSQEWLPSWSWTRAAEVEEELFGRLRATGTPEAYTLNRTFIIRHPAGDAQALTTARNRAGAEPLAEYVPIPDGQIHTSSDGRWWWPCPQCRWPMQVNGTLVQCLYRHHRATFQITGRDSSEPTLSVINRGTTRSRALPTAQHAQGAVQVQTPIWQFIVVPGTTELAIYDTLAAAGATVVMYPHFDRYDLLITVGARCWDVDVKEHLSLERLIAHLEEKPPVARIVVLPDSHAAQKQVVADRLDAHTVLLRSELERQVKNAIKQMSSGRHE